jgi:tyrosine-protein kinase Etk/Wzc
MMEQPVNQPVQPQSPFYVEEPLNIRKSLSKILLNWHWFALSLIFFLCTAFLITRFSKPVYEARTSLLFESAFYPGTGTESLGSDVFQGLGKVGSMSNIYDQAVLICSTPLIERVLHELNFEISYFTRSRSGLVERYKDVPFTVEIDKTHLQPVDFLFDLQITAGGKLILNGKGENVELYDYNLAKGISMVPDLFVSGTFESGSKFESENYAFTIRLKEGFAHRISENYKFMFSTRLKLLNKYKSSVSVNIPEEKSSILEVSLKDSNIPKAFDFLNKITELYLEDNLDRKNKNALRTIDFIADQLKTMSDSLLISQNELQQFQASTQVMDFPLQTPMILSQMNELDKEKMILETKNKYYTYLKEYIGSNQDLESIIAPSAMIIEDPLLNSLIVELNKLVVAKSSLTSVRTPEHPQLKAINAQIESIKNTLLENVNNILSQSQISLADLNTRLQKAQERVNSLPATERNYVNIERKYKLHSENLTFLLQKFSEAQIAKASNFPDSQVLEPAYFRRLISPKSKMNYIFALIMGLLIPSSILYLKDFFSNKITSEEDIKLITHLPILGSIFKNTGENESPTLVLNKPSSATSELYRAIRGKLSLITSDKGTPVIAVTSTFPNEGKTYNAINIASSFALMKKKTVLLDLDLRNSKFRENFGIASVEGVVNYINGKNTLSEITYKSIHPFLSLIPAGPIPPDPGDILADENVIKLLHELKRVYEVIIIDNLPVGLVADLFQLREEIDATVYVVRYQFTYRTTLKTALAEVQANKMKCVGILFNYVQRTRQVSGYGYNKDYIYGYDNTNKSTAEASAIKMKYIGAFSYIYSTTKKFTALVVTKIISIVKSLIKSRPVITKN